MRWCVHTYIVQSIGCRSLWHLIFRIDTVWKDCSIKLDARFQYKSDFRRSASGAESHSSESKIVEIAEVAEMINGWSLRFSEPHSHIEQVRRYFAISTHGPTFHMQKDQRNVDLQNTTCKFSRTAEIGPKYHGNWKTSCFPGNFFWRFPHVECRKPFYNDIFYLLKAIHLSLFNDLFWYVHLFIYLHVCISGFHFIFWSIFTCLFISDVFLMIWLKCAAMQSDIIKSTVPFLMGTRAMSGPGFPSGT